MTFGLIGFGRFGRLAGALLAPHGEVVVYDPALTRRPAGLRGLRRGTLEEAAGQPVVVLAVPVSRLQGVLREIRSRVRPGAIVVDVCAVKARPISWMRRLLPPDVQVLGTHPMFGPDSYGGGLAGLHVYLCPVRGTAWRRMAALLRRTGLVVHVVSADQHDRLMAETVFLTQCIGRMIAAAALQEREEGTVHYRRLRSIMAAAEHDTVQLFQDMWRYNPHARRVARRLGAGWRQVEMLLAGRGRPH